jgi:hypothetical protein
VRAPFVRRPGVSADHAKPSMPEVIIFGGLVMNKGILSPLGGATSRLCRGQGALPELRDDLDVPDNIRARLI